MAEEGTAALARLRRFLYTGLEGNRYAPGRRDFSAETVHSVAALLSEKRGADIIAEVLKLSRDGPRPLCPDASAYALALCAASSCKTTKCAAYGALKEVCPNPAQLFAFSRFLEEASQGGTGWGRAHRWAVTNWYTTRRPRELAAHVTRVVRRHSWTHVDVLRLAHVKPPDSSAGIVLVLKYLAKGFQAAQDHFMQKCSNDLECREVLEYLRGVHEVKHSTDEQSVARLIEIHDLALEHIPTHFLKSKEIWLCLIPRLPLRILVEQLPRLARNGLLLSRGGGGTVLRPLLERLQSDNALGDCPLGPLETYTIVKQCEAATHVGTGRARAAASATGGGKRGHRHHRSQLEDALMSLHVASFKTVPTTGKRYLVAVDVRSPMAHSRSAGLSAVTPAEAAGILLQALANAEPSVTALAFSARGMVDLGVNNKMTLADIRARMRETPMGPVSPAVPLRWAQEQRRSYDLFLICTDTQTQPGDTHPAEALKEYRKALHLPQARLVTCAMCSKGFSLAPPDEFGMLDIAGFDVNVLRIVQDFACGLI
ncbi:RNA-binding protein Ro60-like [Ornithodoros turicata]|uniref:RNA-binding protein Ro60-like n=1 Tax=Ornithodoros turicata TaxID=34597 RepID=UPI00313A4828